MIERLSNGSTDRHEICDTFLSLLTLPTDHREILHGNAYWHVDAHLPYRQLRIRPFKNPRWRMAAILTVKKSRYVDKGLADRDDLTVTHLKPD